MTLVETQVIQGTGGPAQPTSLILCPARPWKACQCSNPSLGNEKITKVFSYETGKITRVMYSTL